MVDRFTRRRLQLAPSGCRYRSDPLRRIFDFTIRPPYVLLRDGLTDLLFDRRLGVRTSGEIQLDRLAIAGEGRQRYKGAPWFMLRRILPRDFVTSDDVFLDIGSGMGRVLLMAAAYPFKRVIGVELSDQLNDIARENIKRSKDRLRCRHVSVIQADATEYVIPDDVTVIFMNNPFQGAIFNAVLKNMLDSYDRKPRPLRIIYGNPVEESILLSTGRIQIVRRLHGFRPGREWSRSNSATLYTVQPR